MHTDIHWINRELPMDLQLDGKKALITGSSKGIGEAIAKTLAREKAIVVIHGRDEILTEKVAHAITSARRTCLRRHWGSHLR